MTRLGSQKVRFRVFEPSLKPATESAIVSPRRTRAPNITNLTSDSSFAATSVVSTGKVEIRRIASLETSIVSRLRNVTTPVVIRTMNHLTFVGSQYDCPSDFVFLPLPVDAVAPACIENAGDCWSWSCDLAELVCISCCKGLPHPEQNLAPSFRFLPQYGQRINPICNAWIIRILNSLCHCDLFFPFR